MAHDFGDLCESELYDSHQLEELIFECVIDFLPNNLAVNGA